MKYDFDSYLLYEGFSKLPLTVRIKVVMKQPVDADVLKNAAVKAFKRYPYFNKKVRIDEEGGYVFESNDNPIAVLPEIDKSRKLGGAEANNHLFMITYSNQDIYFSFSHSICGACGAMSWVKTTLWQYLTDKTGDVITGSDIRLPDSALEEGETAVPDADSLPKDEPVGTFQGGSGYMPLGDYLKYYLNPFAKSPVYIPIEFDLHDMLRYAKDNDGSINSIIAALMFKAVYRMWKDNKKVTQINAGIANNYRSDVGCPNTYCDLIRIMHVKFTKNMADWSIEKLSTAVRGSMYLQMEPEVSCQEYRRRTERYSEIDQVKTNKAKRKYAAANSALRRGIRDSFNISYVGKIDWGDLDKYIESVWTICDGHLMFEVNAIGDKLFVSFGQVNRKTDYLNSLLDVLKEENISYKLGEMQEKNLPIVEFNK